MTLPSYDVQLTRDYFMLRRQVILMELDYIERMLEIQPRVSELREEAKKRKTQYNKDTEKGEQ